MLRTTRLRCYLGRKIGSLYIIESGKFTRNRRNLVECKLDHFEWFSARQLGMVKWLYTSRLGKIDLMPHRIYLYNDGLKTHNTIGKYFRKRKGHSDLSKCHSDLAGP